MIAVTLVLCSQPFEDIGAQGFDLDSAMEKVKKANKKIAEAESKVTATSDETRDLLEAHRAVERHTQALAVYNAQLESLIESQNQEIASLREQIDKVIVVGRQITPLMLRMINTLEKFVELDVPFLLEERRKRVADLGKMMKRADVTDSEKYRRLLEAFQIENEYGRTIEAYRGDIELEGKKSTVDFIRVGRILLLYQTLDGQQAGVWDKKDKAWTKLPREYLNAIPKALRIARKQSAPDLIRLPIPAPRRNK